MSIDQKQMQAALTRLNPWRAWANFTRRTNDGRKVRLVDWKNLARR